MSIPTYSTLLFDLDGTLTDPFEGVSRSMIYAMERLGQPVPTEAMLRTWIGPPLHESFQLYLNSDKAMALEAVEIYRERYEPIGAYENLVYPGIAELLGELHAAGCRLALATSKLESAALNILRHFGLEPFFEVVAGSSRDSSLSAKADIIALALERLGAQGQGGLVMVGDRLHDIIGARVNGLPCIAVAYGYGSVEELSAHAPLAIAATVAELRELLMKE